MAAENETLQSGDMGLFLLGLSMAETGLAVVAVDAARVRGRRARNVRGMIDEVRDILWDRDLRQLLAAHIDRFDAER